MPAPSSRMPMLTIAPPPASSSGERAPAALVVEVEKPADDATLGVTVTSDDVGRVVVRLLAPDSAFLNAGLLVGDEILEVNGKPTKGAKNVTAALKSAPRGRVELLIQRLPRESARAKPVIPIVLSKESSWSACDLLLELGGKDVVLVKGMRPSAGIAGDVRIGTRLLTINGQEVHSVEEAETIFGKLEPGPVTCLLSPMAR